MKKLVWCWLLIQVQWLHAQTNVGKGIIITEIMPDPSPQVALPLAEYIELYNSSSDTIDLFKWIIQADHVAAMINKSFILAPGSYVVCCPQSQVSSFDSGVRVIGLSGFPSLDNDGAVLQVLDADRKIMHALAYQQSWYGNPVKENGGWSLEMMDVSKSCIAAGNWKASVDPAGGTPGMINSVRATITDEEPPRLLRAFCRDSITVVVIFNETLDLISSSQPSAFTYSERNIKYAEPIGPLFHAVLLTLDQPLKKGTEYMLHVKTVRDCSGNDIGGFGNARVGMPDKPEKSSVVINELLFNPRSGGSDYVELLNVSNTVFDLQDLFLGTRNAANGLQSVTGCSSFPRLMFPGDHIVITSDSAVTIQHYLVKEPMNLVEHSGLPGMADQKGVIVLINKDGSIIDEVQYSEDWHFPLLTDPEGVALERISYKLPANDPTNWTSAAASVGFGTPTYKNSQLYDVNVGPAAFKVIPTVFSPDGDGHDDYTMVAFNLEQPGMMGTVTILDIRGRPVCMLISNSNLAQTGSFRWNGLDMYHRRAPPGMYIVLMDVFNLQGKRKKYKASVIIAADY